MKQTISQTAPPISRPNIGIQNIGNTDFLAAGLQCLYHTYELTQYFINDNYKKQLNISNPLGAKGQVANAYANFIKQAWKSTNNSALKPTELKQVIGKYQPMFAGYQAHDCIQFLSFFVDFLHEDLNRVLKKPVVNAVQDKGRPDKQVAYQNWANYLKRNQSIITDLMTGQLKSTMVCEKCQNLSVTFDPFIFPSLPIPEANAIITLAECFSFNQQCVKSQQQDWYCPKCKTFRRYTMVRQFYKAPQIFIMKLNRVKKQANKNYKQQAKIVFPLQINLQKYLLDPQPFTSYQKSLQKQGLLSSSFSSSSSPQLILKPSSSDPIYELYAVNVHHGSMEGGHYITYAKNQNKWWLFDDSYVVEVSQEKVLDAQAYALFYRRKC